MIRYRVEPRERGRFAGVLRCRLKAADSRNLLNLMALPVTACSATPACNFVPRAFDASALV
jgi:hypothetical protein